MSTLGIPVVTVTMTLPRDPSLFVRDHNRFAREANTYAAQYHWEHHIGRHFQGFASAKYGYWQRTKGYKRRKKNLVGNKPDNVFSGRSQREITNTPPKIRATPKRATLVMRLPIDGGTGRILDEAAAARKFAAGKRKNKGFTERQVNSQIQIQRRVAEMKTVSPDEINKLTQVRLDRYTVLVNGPGVKKRIRFRGK